MNTVVGKVGLGECVWLCLSLNPEFLGLSNMGQAVKGVGGGESQSMFYYPRNSPDRVSFSNLSIQRYPFL